MRPIDKRAKNLVKALEAEGWRVERKKNAYMAFPPDKGKQQVTFHLTSSDSRWYANTIARLRRSGFTG